MIEYLKDLLNSARSKKIGRDKAIQLSLLLVVVAILLAMLGSILVSSCSNSLSEVLRSWR